MWLAAHKCNCMSCLGKMKILCEASQCTIDFAIASEWALTINLFTAKIYRLHGGIQSFYQAFHGP